MRRCTTVLAASLLALAPAGHAQLAAPPGVGPDNAQGATLDLLRDVRIDQRLGELLPLDATVRTHKGDAVELRSLFEDRPLVLALVYYECPMLCTLALEGLLETLRAVDFSVGQEFDIALLSVDPDETPELASAQRANLIDAYGRAGEQGWHVLTASAESIARITEAVGFRYAYDPRTGEYAHAAGVQVVTPDGRLSRYFYGIEIPSRDLRLGLVEASAGKIGTVIDAALLWCYRYDPATGRYGFVIVSSIRILGIATVAGIALFVFRQLRRERSRPTPEVPHRA